MVKYFVFMLLIGCFSCKKKISNDTLIIGHAGTGLKNTKSIFHDNSFESFEYALSFDKCAGVEMDLQLSADGEIWLYHDTKLESETNLNGCIIEKNEHDLKNSNYTGLTNESLIKLEKIKELSWNEKNAFFDVRHASDCSNNLLTVQNFLLAFNKSLVLCNSAIKPNIILSTNAWIDAFDSLDCALFVSCNSYAEAFSFENDLRVDGIIIKNAQISKSETEKLKNRFQIAIFDVRSVKKTKEALNKNPDFLIVDDVEIGLNLKK